MKSFNAIVVAALGFAAPLSAVEPADSTAINTLTLNDNAELRTMFEKDQAVRKNPAAVDWTVVERDDAARRSRLQEMLDLGLVRTGRDYWHAAFIFQHGNEPKHYLKAHVLATAAIANGYGEAKWISAATLDRYLHSIGQAQIFGTQYRWNAKDGSSMGNYDPKQISDKLREEFGVRTLERQKEGLQKMIAAERAAKRVIEAENSIE